MRPLPDAEGCWEAVQGRDASLDGTLYYGVLTTGVFCRPSCPSRRPLRENVRFYGSAEEAAKDGLRPCKRCRPLEIAGGDRLTERIRDLCRFMEKHADEGLTLDDLSERAQLSKFHLQRMFKAVMGVTPKEYLDHARMEKLKMLLREEKGESVTGAIFGAGFGSLSRLYEKADTRLGMTPMEYREGGRGVQITCAAAETRVGLMLLGATDRGLCFLQFGEDRAELERTIAEQYPNAEIQQLGTPSAELVEWIAQLNRYLEGQEPDLRLPVHVRATAFQMMVWKYLQSIPAGAVESYQEVAKGIGQPTAARAVARACASNLVALAIPCHRVIRGNGELGGYRWGVERKRVLLDQERGARAGRAL